MKSSQATLEANSRSDGQVAAGARGLHASPYFPRGDPVTLSRGPSGGEHSAASPLENGIEPAFAGPYDHRGQRRVGPMTLPLKVIPWPNLRAR